MEKGDRIQYACGHWLVAGSFGIRDDTVLDVTTKRCGECQRRLQDAAPQLLEALEQIYDESRDPKIERIAQAAIALTISDRDPVQ